MTEQNKQNKQDKNSKQDQTADRDLENQRAPQSGQTGTTKKGMGVPGNASPDQLENERTGKVSRRDSGGADTKAVSGTIDRDNNDIDDSLDDLGELEDDKDNDHVKTDKTASPGGKPSSTGFSKR